MKTKFTKLPLKKQDESKTVHFFVDKTKGVVVCTLKDRFCGRVFTGKTKCHDVDQFNEKKGRAIAFNKARLKELKFNLSLCEKDLQYVEEQYQMFKNKIEKRQNLNYIYLTGVQDELNELMNN